jgi:hypothetical protein
LKGVGYSPLVLASSKLLPEVVDLLILYDADVDALSITTVRGPKVTALLAACTAQEADSADKEAAWRVCDSLLRAAANPNIDIAHGYSAPLALSRSPSLTALLLRYGAAVAFGSSSGLGIVACCTGNSPSGCIQLLLQAGANPSPSTSSLYNPLAQAIHLARLSGSCDTLDFLLWAGCDPNVATFNCNNKNYFRPVLFNIEAETPKELIKSLLWYGADKTKCDSNGFLPVQIAWLRGFPMEVLHLLSPHDGFVMTDNMRFKENGDIFVDPTITKQITITMEAPGPPVFRVFELEFTFCTTCRKSDGDFWTCEGCSLVAYCGEDCQRVHWKAHRKVCKRKQEVDGLRAKFAQ